MPASQTPTLIEINLLPEELRKKKKAKSALHDVPVKRLAVGLVIFLVLVEAALGAYAVIQKQRLGAISHEIARLTEQTQDVARMKSEINATKVRLKEVSDLQQRKFYWAKLLNALSDSTTKGVWLTGFSVQEVGDPKKGPMSLSRIVRLEGSAVGQGQETAVIGKFIKELKDNPELSAMFEEVKLVNINQKKIRDVDVYDFVLLAVFKKDIT